MALKLRSYTDSTVAFGASPTKTKAAEVARSYPASVSIAQLLNAGKFVKPEWKTAKCLSLFVDDDKFASGAFLMAFKGTLESGSHNNNTFPLAVYGLQDVFSGYVLYLKLWPSNSDPKLIARWYVEYLYESRGKCS